MEQNLITTGAPGLDALLGGGVSPGSLMFVIGAPGAGKTILGTQMLFAAARAGMGALMLTVYSEGHEKLLEHLQGFDFFDLDLIGTRIQLVSTRGMVGEEAAATADELMRTIRSSGAQLVLIDGFQGLAPFTQYADQTRQSLARISSQLSYINTTICATLAGEPHDLALHPLLTTADCSLGLHFSVDGLRHTRDVEVIKQRGRAQLPGLHPFHITSRGLVVTPRLEAYPQAITGPRPQGRTPFGLPDLDRLINGGLTAGTISILAGAPGVGKTTLALHWALQDAQPDASSLFVTFREQHEQLVEKAATFGLPLSEAEAAGSLEVIRVAPVNIDPDALALELLERFHNATVRKVIIDNVMFLTKALGNRADDFYAALIEHLYGEGVTTLCTFQLEPFSGLKVELSRQPLAALADNVIAIQQEENEAVVRRLITVVRMSFSDYDRSVCELELDEQGLRVHGLGEPPASNEKSGVEQRK